MSSAIWVAIYMPLFIVFFVILPQQHEIQKLIILKSRKRKGLIIMTNEVIKKYIGKNCKISRESFGKNAKGK